MRNRLIVLTATVALLLVGAVPVSAAPGGVPGPPSGHHKSGDDVVTDDVETPEDDQELSSPPIWALAYGKRIKDAYGIPFGHLQQCARDVAAAEGDEVAADGEADGAKKALQNCPDPNTYMFPEGRSGASSLQILVDFVGSGFTMIAR